MTSLSDDTEAATKRSPVRHQRLARAIAAAIKAEIEGSDSLPDIAWCSFGIVSLSGRSFSFRITPVRKR